MRHVSLVSLAFLVACPETTGDKVGTLDSGDVVCDRVHGARGVVRYGYDDAGTPASEDDEWSVHFPDTAPDGVTKTTGVGGPLLDGESYAAIFGGRLLISSDAGCNWDDQGGVLPSTGDWRIFTANGTLYAFDRASSAGAFSEDDGASWTATDASEPFIGLPVADPSIPGKLRGVQARGVVSTDDRGVNWYVSGTVPAGTVTGAAVWSGGLDSIIVATVDGVSVSRTGGNSWDEAGAALIAAGIAPARVAIHPSNADQLWVSGTDDNGGIIESSADGGTTWSLVAAQRNIDLDLSAELWPDPNEADVLLSHFDSAEGDGTVVMYRLFGGNIESHKVSTYRGMSDIAFLDDGGWIAGVDSVP